MKDDPKLSPWKVIEEYDEIRNQWLGVKNVTFELPNGKVMKDYYIVDKPESVVIMLIHDKKTYLIREYERAANEVGYKLPSGGIEQDETPRDAAVRELREELGLDIRELISLGSAYTDPGYITQRTHYFLCIDFEVHDESREESPYELFVGEWVDLNTIEKMIIANEIQNPYVIVATMLAKSKLAEFV